MNIMRHAMRPKKDVVVEARLTSMIGFLQGMVLAPPTNRERFHAIFVSVQKQYLGDASLGYGEAASLTLKMRELFSRALSAGASGLIVAHNHPSGDCRPSTSDIEATQRLSAVARALDIELLDHLIFTTRAAYSMRAGGNI